MYKYMSEARLGGYTKGEISPRDFNDIINSGYKKRSIVYEGVSASVYVERTSIPERLMSNPDMVVATLTALEGSADGSVTEYQRIGQVVMNLKSGRFGIRPFSYR